MAPCLLLRPAVQYEPGTVYSILASCYAGIRDPAFENRLREFDRDVFANPDTIGVCTLISSVDKGNIESYAMRCRWQSECTPRLQVHYFDWDHRDF